MRWWLANWKLSAPRKISANSSIRHRVMTELSNGRRNYDSRPSGEKRKRDDDSPQREEFRVDGWVNKKWSLIQEAALFPVSYWHSVDLKWPLQFQITYFDIEFKGLLGWLIWLSDGRHDSRNSADVINNINDCSVLLKHPSKPGQCDSDPACTTQAEA